MGWIKGWVVVCELEGGVVGWVGRCVWIGGWSCDVVMECSWGGCWGWGLSIRWSVNWSCS